MVSEGYIRLLRHLGLAALVMALPTAGLLWLTGEGAVVALILLVSQLYVGAFAAWGLPWVLRRQRRNDTSEPG
jgi:hypothetical protein